jgi:hypothetical protein
MKQEQFKHNLDKAKRQRQQDRHEVKPKEAREALKYFWNVGLHNTYGDQEYYLKILMRYSANKLNLLLVDENQNPL